MTTENALSEKDTLQLLTDLGLASKDKNEAAVNVSSCNKKGPASPTEDRVISLLGAGVSPEFTAAAVGITPSRLSQMLSNEEFAKRVAEAKYKNLQRHNEIDARYDSLEDKLLTKLEEKLPLMMKPETVLNAIKIVNAAKRKGASNPTQITTKQQVVSIMLPQAILQQFVVTNDNQVIKAGEQELITMPSGALRDRVEAAQESRLLTDNSPKITGDKLCVQGQEVD